MAWDEYEAVPPVGTPQACNDPRLLSKSGDEDGAKYIDVHHEDVKMLLWKRRNAGSSHLSVFLTVPDA